MSASKSQNIYSTPTSNPTPCGRILRMSTVWATLGVVIGTSIGIQAGGMTGAIVAMMVGMVELAVLGVTFAIVGGTPEETMLGGVAGLLVGLSACAAGGQAPIVLVTNFGLLVGAILGATLRAYVRLLSLPIILLGRPPRSGHRSRDSA
jgi:hypothetical protein